MIKLNESYKRISSADLTEGLLHIVFENGDSVSIDPAMVVTRDLQAHDWERVEAEGYELRLTSSEGAIAEVPWDSLRAVTDADFAAEMAVVAEEQAQTIGTRIRALRKSRGLSSRELAERAGITPQSMSRIELGRHDVVFTTLKRILAAMAYTLRDLARLDQDGASADTEEPNTTESTGPADFSDDLSNGPGEPIFTVKPPEGALKERSPLLRLTFYIELPLDAGLSNDQAFNSIDFVDPLLEWADLDLPAMLEMPPPPLDGVRPCTALYFRRVTRLVASPLSAVADAFGDEIPAIRSIIDSESSELALRESRSVVRAVRIASHPSGLFGERWLREQFQGVLAAINRTLLAIGAAKTDHSIAPIHSHQLPFMIHGFQRDLRRGPEAERPFFFLAHPHGPTTADEEFSDEAGNFVLEILEAMQRGGPLFGPMEFFYAARRSLDQGLNSHAVLEAGTAAELLVGSVLQGRGMADDWSDAQWAEFFGRDGSGGSVKKRFKKFLELLGLRFQPQHGVDPANRWWREGYKLRNQVAHAGLRPDDADAQNAVRLAGELIDFVGLAAFRDSAMNISIPVPEELKDELGEDALRVSPIPPTFESKVVGDAADEARRALEGKDLKRAADAFATAAEAGDVASRFNLGVVLAEMGALDEALAALKQAESEGHPKAPVNRGTLLLSKGDIAGAQQAYEVGASSGHAEAAPLAGLGLGRLLLTEGDREGAKSEFQRAAAFDDSPAAVEAAFELGVLHQEDEDFRAAIDAYHRAVELGSARAAINRGNLLAAQGRLEDAEAAFRQAIEMGEGSERGQARFNLGLLFHQQGRDDEANEALEEAASEEEPQSELLLATMAIERNDIAAARRHLRAARESEYPDIAKHAGELSKSLEIED